jgi:penicillin-binding protein activator
MIRLSFPFAFLLCAPLLAAATGCGGKEYVRGTQDPSIDNAAMSTGLDKRDIQKMLSDNLNDLRVASVMNDWRSRGERVQVAVFPIINETTEHIESALSATLGETETWLVESGVATVISRERQQQAIAEVEGQKGAAFDQSKAARYGRQLGVKYIVTGKIAGTDERTEDERRVQYFFFMQVIDVETSAILWQHKSYVTKGVR